MTPHWTVTKLSDGQFHIYPRPQRITHAELLDLIVQGWLAANFSESHVVSAVNREEERRKLLRKVSEAEGR